MDPKRRVSLQPCPSVVTSGADTQSTRQFIDKRREEHTPTRQQQGLKCTTRLARALAPPPACGARPSSRRSGASEASHSTNANPRIGEVVKSNTDQRPARLITVVFTHGDAADQSHPQQAQPQPQQQQQQQQQQQYAEEGEARDHPPVARWGQTAAYLPDHNAILFVGGQTNKQGSITNDVYALDLSGTRAKTGANDQRSARGPSHRSNRWIRLSSEGLPPHAFAASTVTGSSSSSASDGAAGEKLWIIGGVTQDCQKDAPAYYWSAPSGDITRGSWSNLTVQGAPVRRHGARAIQLPNSYLDSIVSSTQVVSQSGGSSLSITSMTNSSGTTVMVVGGTADSSVCYTVSGDNRSVRYVGADLWNAGASYKQRRPASFVRSFGLDTKLQSLPLVDYSTVLVPGDKSSSGDASDKVVFIGGKVGSGELAQLERLWVLNLRSGNWERWTTSGQVPAGRMGHSSVLTSDGKIIVHGGYLADPNDADAGQPPATPTNEVHVLDLSSRSPTWSQADIGQGSEQAPSRAYHSAVMAGDTMVVAFGQASHGQAAGHQVATSAGDESDDQEPAIHYLNVGSNAGGWSWSSSKAKIASPSERLAVSRESSSGSHTKPSGEATTQDSASKAPAASSDDKPASADSGTSGQNGQAFSQLADQSSAAGGVSRQEAQAAAESGEGSASPSQQPEAAAPVTDAATKGAASADAPVVVNAAHKPEAPARKAQPEASGSNSSSSHTGAIAGSVLGAAAVAAALGGLYAYRKRREAEAYQLGRAKALKKGGSDDDGLQTMGNLGSRGPPVSNLWLHQPAAWASAAGKGLRRAASSATVLSLGGGWRRKARDVHGRNRDDDSVEVGVGAFSPMHFGGSRNSCEAKSPHTTSPSKSAFQVLRSFRGSGSGKRQDRTPVDAANASCSVLPDAFISSLADDESPDVFSRSDKAHKLCDAAAPRETLAVPSAAAVAGGEFYALNHRNASTDSFSSVSSFGSASHFSYPFLSAMHRPSLANMSHAPGSDGEARPREVMGGLAPSAGSADSGSPLPYGSALSPFYGVTSPNTVGATIAALNLSPRDAAVLASLANPHLSSLGLMSPYHQTVLMQEQGMRATMALELHDQDLDSTVSIDGVSSLDAPGGAKPFVRPFALAEPQAFGSPLFPWQLPKKDSGTSPTIVRPPPRAKLTDTSVWTLMRRKSTNKAAAPTAAGAKAFVSIDMVPTVDATSVDDAQGGGRKATVDPFEDDDDEAIIFTSMWTAPRANSWSQTQRLSDEAVRAGRLRSSLRAKTQTSFRITNEA
ncbi:hypothetical protein ACQY0O_001366 [Thecaphora frezii]